MKVAITIGIIMLMLASGFIFFNYDRADRGVKILNDDDYKQSFIGTPTPIPSELKTPEVLERARSLPVGEGITAIKEVEN